ncbi:BamA/TamA family outer membrane protein [candidate division KSB1 bacterium]|nr:BamA/TamA family outer membrane protein [candidate division KSB1 bacterium]
MMRNALCGGLALIIGVFLLALPVAVCGQFKYSQIAQDTLEPGRVVNFYTTPRYNRVEGLFLNVGAWVNIFSTHRLIGRADVGIGIKNRGPNTLLAVQKHYFSQNRLVIQAELFDQTTSNEYWRAYQFENTLAALFLHEDFFNYYGNRGWRIVADQVVKETIGVRVGYTQRRVVDMAVNSHFAASLFGNSKTWRRNPAVNPGDERVLEMQLRVDRRDNRYFPKSGWMVDLVYQHGAGDFATEGIFIVHRNYVPIWSSQRLVLIFFAGFRSGQVQPHHLMTIGGISSLRAFPEYYRTGQNLTQANFNFLFGQDLIRRLRLHRLPTLDSFSLGAFIDVGDAWNSSRHKNNLFSRLSGADWLVDGGFSLLFLDGFVRIDFARQLRGGDGDWRITLRLVDKL